MNDQQLIEHMRVRREAVLDIEMINALQEIYARRLYLAHGSPSFHAFCTQVLGMSDDSAWRRMHAAKLANAFPRAKQMIEERTLSMTNAALLSKVATAANADRLFDEVANKSKREVEVILRREDPKPDLTSGTRYVPNWLQREVRERDGHRCTFVGPGGRCVATRDLQVHHVVAYALGGLTVGENLTLHCAAHNRHRAELDLGVAWANTWRDAR